MEIQVTDSRVALLVIPTDEEYEIASQILQVINNE
jgi:acetate kinase